MGKMRDMRSAPFDVGLPRVIQRRRNIVQTIPTGNVRHLPAIRNGKVNYEEAFSRAARERIPLDPDVERNLKLGRGKEIAIDAAEKLREGREESQARDAKKVRKETRHKHLLREGKQTRSRKVKAGEDKQHVQKGRKAKKSSDKPPKVKSQGRTPQKQKVKKYVKRKPG